ncbi:MAG: glucose/arabinose dehydrogenase/cytochrome c553 [Planctomycetota bacterium]|jgi:glucose/arabinose dehydrogenase/cytochrome c553
MTRTILCIFRLALTALIVVTAGFAQDDKPRIVFLVGEEEYGSEETMPRFAEGLERELGVDIDVRVASGRLMPEPPALDEADLLVLYLRFREPTDAQLAALNAWFDAGKPALALRTTSHLFWEKKLKGWFPPRFGGHYKAHAANGAGTSTSIAASAPGHAILRGMPDGDSMGYGGTYNAQPLMDGATALLFGRTGELPAEPVAWTFEPAPGVRRFYTSLGSKGNFERDSFRLLLANAVLWGLDREVPANGAPGYGGAGRQLEPAMETPAAPRAELPDGASSLFSGLNSGLSSGGSLEAWRHWDPSVEPRAIGIDTRADSSSGGPRYDFPRWETDGGALVARPGFGDLVTKEEFGDYHLHLDFLVPREDAAAAAGFRGASGVYLSGRWEVQLAASGGAELTDASSGAIYGERAPLVDAARPAGVWQSLDVTYEHAAGGPAQASVWLNGVLVQDDVALVERTPYGFREPLAGMSVGDGEARFASKPGVESQKIDWSADSFAVSARFRSRAGGTLFSKCPPSGKWVPNAKALFLRGGKLVYDIGWIGAASTGRRFDDGEWHQVVLSSDDAHARIWVDGELQAEKEDFGAEDRRDFVFKVGAANADFGGAFGGEVSDVRFFAKGLTPTEARALSSGTVPKRTASFAWTREEESAGPVVARGDSLRGPIRLQADSSRVRFANVWVKPLADLDHAALIATWGDESFERGKQTYMSACVNCHGADGRRPTNPQARPFATGVLERGSDPLSMYRTIMEGFRTMPSNRWLAPEQTYDLVHFLRESFLRDENPSQYFDVSTEYLAALPKGRKHGAGAGETDSQVDRDFGPVLATQLGDDVGACLTVRLGPQISMAYDLQLLESPGAWTGGFLELEQTQHYQQRGEARAKPKGTPLEGLEGYGWGHGGTLDWDRSVRPPRGPLPSSLLDYHGHYLHGRDVILSYAIDGREVLERPGLDASAGLPVITHRIRVEPGEQPLVLELCHAPKAPQMPETVFSEAGSEDGYLPWNMIARGAPEGENLAYFAAAAVLGEGRLTLDDERRVVLHVPPSGAVQEFFVLRLASESADDLEGFEFMLDNLRERPLPVSPAAQVAGGPARWAEELVTQGKLGTETPYALDTLTLPETNPWNAWIRTSALDFFPDGRAAVSTYGGDVWIVSGIDGDLSELRWRRFAAGMFEPMGVKVIDGLVYVTCRDRITRLHDRNGDGEADFYESFFADPDVSPNFHAFNFDLQTDGEGALYYAKSGQYTDFALPGGILKVAPDGLSYEVYCTGLRTPNGMGMSPDGRPLVSDNQGNWIPASKISLARPGGFYGVFTAINTNRAGKKTRDDFDQPVVWMPQKLDSSSGGQLWVDDQRFGPLAGRYLHTSFGKGWMYGLVVDEHEQGAVWRLPFQFDAGLQRLRVNPSDGQVYTVGLSGWQGPAGGADGCLQRVRYSGGGQPILIAARAHPRGVELEFSAPVNLDSARGLEGFAARRWNYRWTRDYGSAHYSVEQPDREGEDEIVVLAARPDVSGRKVVVELEDMQPCDQLFLQFELQGPGGEPAAQEVYLTVHKVPE